MPRDCELSERSNAATHHHPYPPLQGEGFDAASQNYSDQDVGLNKSFLQVEPEQILPFKSV